MIDRLTLHEFFLEERSHHAHSPSLWPLVSDLAAALEAISTHIGKGGLSAKQPESTGENVQGEQQKPLDLFTNKAILRACERNGHLAGMVSEELDDHHPIPAGRACGEYLLSFDPLDGSSNVDVDVTMGTIFSILRRPGGAGPASREDFLQAGAKQVCAGYALYGPSTMLVLSFGRGVQGFTLDRKRHEFLLTHPDLRIPETTREIAINASNERFWEPPVRRYVAECLSGSRGAEFVTRWVGAMVAEVHRILIRGGIYLYPKDSKLPQRAGRLRLLYEINPLSFLVEQAGGLATTGYKRVLEIVPSTLHQRLPIILGSREEVERVVRYHHDHSSGADRPYRSPLFGERSLFTKP